MKIVFFPTQCLPIHGKTLEERPLGGTESAIIRLAKTLYEMGHDVRVISEFDKPPVTAPLYMPRTAIKHLGPVDALISIRNWNPLLLPIDAKKRFFWTGDAHDQPHSIGIGDKRIADKVDGFLCASQWQAEMFAESSGFPLEKTWTIRYGIHAPYFEKEVSKNRKRLIYSSTPYRGLAHLPKIYNSIKSKHPDCELHVFSGYKVYDNGSGQYNEQAEREFEVLSKLLNALPDCYLHGNVNQEQLALEFQKSAVLAYPNTFAETGCITALEAQAGGCAIVSSKLGALPETVGDAGILIDGTPGSEEYDNAFVDAVDKLLSNDKEFEKYSNRGLERAKDFSWEAIAGKFVDYLKENHELS